MATEQVDSAAQEIDFPTLCHAVADASPMPMAGLGGSLHTLRYVNLAFCLLTGKSKDELIGTAFCGITPGTNECMLLLDRVVKTGLADSYIGEEHPGQSGLAGICAAGERLVSEVGSGEEARKPAPSGTAKCALGAWAFRLLR